MQVNCFYPPYPPLGGGTIYCHSLVSALKIHHEVRVFAGRISDPPTPIPYYVTTDCYEGTRTSRVVLNYNNFDDFDRHSVLSYCNPLVQVEFEKCLRDFAPDLVHFHSLQGLGALLLVSAKKRGIPVVVTLHDSWWLCARQFFLLPDRRTVCSGASFLKCIGCITGPTKRENTHILGFLATRIAFAMSVALRFYLLRSTLKLADLVILPSHYLLSRYEQYSVTSSAYVSRNGIEMEPLHRRNVSPRRIRFGFLGGLSEEKGFGLILRAVEALEPSNWQLKIWGIPPGYTLGTESHYRNVKFMGEFDRSETSTVFSQIDVLLFPSFLPENCPLTVLESLACGVPVIGSRIGGVPELLRDGIDGLLFSPGSEAELRNCMQGILLNRRLLPRMRSEIRARKIGTIADQSTEIERLYENIRRHRAYESRSLSRKFNLFAAKSYFWTYVAAIRFFGFVRSMLADPEQGQQVAIMRSGFSRNKIAKAVPGESKGQLETVMIYCDNLDRREHIVDVEISHGLSYPPVIKKMLMLAPRSIAGWREVPIDMPWDWDTLWLIIHADHDTFVRIGYDLDTPHDQCYTSDGKNWIPQPLRTWVVIKIDSRMVGATDKMFASMSRTPRPKPKFRTLTAWVLLVPMLTAYLLSRITPPLLMRIVRTYRRVKSSSEAR